MKMDDDIPGGDIKLHPGVKKYYPMSFLCQGYGGTAGSGQCFLQETFISATDSSRQTQNMSGESLVTLNKRQRHHSELDGKWAKK